MSHIETRSQEWLENALAFIWYKYFNDINQNNEVIIRWGRKAKTRLGSISTKIDHSSIKDGLITFSSHPFYKIPSPELISIISINKLLQNDIIPEQLIYSVIFHELSHYSHGFNSPLDKKYKYPHRGGVMRREFEERGCLDLYLFQKKWLKENWWDFINKYY